MRRFIDRRSFEPTWIHTDGSFTALNVVRQGEVLVVARRTGVRPR